MSYFILVRAKKERVGRRFREVNGDIIRCTQINDHLNLVVDLYYFKERIFKSHAFLFEEPSRKFELRTGLRWSTCVKNTIDGKQLINCFLLAGINN